jgi:hypothetical protein
VVGDVDNSTEVGGGSAVSGVIIWSGGLVVEAKDSCMRRSAIKAACFCVC